MSIEKRKLQSFDFYRKYSNPLYFGTPESRKYDYAVFLDEYGRNAVKTLPPEQRHIYHLLSDMLARRFEVLERTPLKNILKFKRREMFQIEIVQSKCVQCGATKKIRTDMYDNDSEVCLAEIFAFPYFEVVWIALEQIMMPCEILKDNHLIHDPPMI